jgi:hypothetical protein
VLSFDRLAVRHGLCLSGLLWTDAKRRRLGSKSWVTASGCS